MSVSGSFAVVSTVQPVTTWNELGNMTGTNETGEEPYRYSSEKLDYPLGKVPFFLSNVYKTKIKF